MTEKEKMLAGMMYDAVGDLDLKRERDRCKDLCHMFNQLSPSDAEGQRKVMQALLGKVGSAFTIMAPFWCDYGENIEIGENFFANHNCIILDCGRVTFGDNVWIGPNCGFYAAAHPLDAQRRIQGIEYALPIHIGHNVWIGGGVHVVPGVTIGADTVIGAGSVVTKDIPSGVVATGNPCRVIRMLEEK